MSRIIITIKKVTIRNIVFHRNFIFQLFIGNLIRAMIASKQHKRYCQQRKYIQKNSSHRGKFTKYKREPLFKHPYKWSGKRLLAIS